MGSSQNAKKKEKKSFRLKEQIEFMYMFMHLSKIGRLNSHEIRYIIGFMVHRERFFPAQYTTQLWVRISLHTSEGKKSNQFGAKDKTCAMVSMYVYALCMYGMKNA